MLRKIHHALMEVHLIEGELVCPETGRKFPVRQGIPNMLLHEDGEMVQGEHCFAIELYIVGFSVHLRYGSQFAPRSL